MSERCGGCSRFKGARRRFSKGDDALPRRDSADGGVSIRVRLLELIRAIRARGVRVFRGPYAVARHAGMIGRIPWLKVMVSSVRPDVSTSGRRGGSPPAVTAGLEAPVSRPRAKAVLGGARTEFNEPRQREGDNRVHVMPLLSRTFAVLRQIGTRTCTSAAGLEIDFVDGAGARSAEPSSSAQPLNFAAGCSTGAPWDGADRLAAMRLAGPIRHAQKGKGRERDRKHASAASTGNGEEWLSTTGDATNREMLWEPLRCGIDQS